jgi:2-keto-4-pentenoate hydratase/2-oxohepta-3-ene-1,7-dioic acid hydratase in catechol pathway
VTFTSSVLEPYDRGVELGERHAQQIGTTVASYRRLFARRADHPFDVDLWAEVNGARVQAGNTRTMVFGVAFLVSYVSRFMSLQAGDIISTGTPPGVGMGMKPPRYLKAGDHVAIGGAGLGRQSRTCVNAN